jgi:hypothetical protein
VVTLAPLYTWLVCFDTAKRWGLLGEVEATPFVEAVAATVDCWLRKAGADTGARA